MQVLAGLHGAPADGYLRDFGIISNFAVGNAGGRRLAVAHQLANENIST